MFMKQVNCCEMARVDVYLSLQHSALCGGSLGKHPAMWGMRGPERTLRRGTKTCDIIDCTVHGGMSHLFFPWRKDSIDTT